ncbi:MAG: LTA synthase family protein [Bdellovibrionales bacterium]|nr:LTA synthase family protein [Bdellovibrionales bacterium]
MTVDLHLSVGQAWKSGLYVGWMSDLAVALLPLSLGLLLAGLARLPLRWAYAVVTVVLWIPLAANVLHFRFFQTSLALWVIRDHWTDLSMLGGSAGSLWRTWPLALAAVAAAGSIALAARTYGPARSVRSLAGLRGALSRVPLPAWQTAGALAVLVSALLLRQSPVWFGWIYVGERHRGNVLTNNVLVQWWAQATEELRPSGTADNVSDRAARGQASELLVKYRDFSDQGVRPAQPRLTQGTEWPLLRRFEPDAAEGARLRAELGLKPEGPVNVLFLFLESVRYFEIGHPQIGPLIFPEIRRILAERSMEFRQAYTSGFIAGQTVRGQFTTLCSNVDAVIGPATYISHYTLRIQCLQNLFRNQGYTTAWINGFLTTFHNKGLFESLHGTQMFFDRDYFVARGVRHEIGDWGLADGPVLQESVKLLEQLPKPWFAHALTLSTHHPHSVVEEGRVPEPLATLAAARPEYLAYLSRLRYADQSVGDFFRAFFASPASKDTLVVLMADHATGIPTHLEIPHEQETEIHFRIPLALLSRDLIRPSLHLGPVHQVDVAPTVATIAGIAGEVSWLGTGLTSAEGRPWLYQAGERIHYRTSRRACYTAPGRERPECFSLARKGLDPLYDRLTTPLPEDESMTEFFRDFVRANDEALSRNWIAPPGAFQDAGRGTASRIAR